MGVLRSRCDECGAMEHWDALTRSVVAAFFYACAYLAGLTLFAMMARRRGIATSGMWTLLQVGLLGGLASAGLLQLLFTAAPGKTLLGALAGGFLSVVLAKRVLGIRRPTGDLWAVSLSGGEAIGRLGCFIGGCCFGKATTVAWAIHDHGAARHPTQLYLSGAALVTLVTLLVLDRCRLPENALFYIQGTMLCTFRFVIEFFRDGAPAAGGLTIAQWACLLGIVFFGSRLAHTMAPQRHRVARPRFATARW